VRIGKGSGTSRPSTHTKLERCSKKDKGKIIISGFVKYVFRRIFINYRLHFTRLIILSLMSKISNMTSIEATEMKENYIPRVVNRR
jgi:hypothetical protein